MSRRKKEEKIEEPLGPSILQVLVEEQQQRSAEEEFSADVAALFCGPKRAGKTTLVDRFINPQKDEKDVPKPTVALEYKFARYASDTSTSKILAHVYDLGGDESNEVLVPIPVSAATVGNLVVSVVLDCSEPHNMLSSLNKWLDVLRAQVQKSLEALAQESPNGKHRVEVLTKARKDLYEEHADAATVNPFPLSLVIFAMKWDALGGDVDPEKRKNLARALRYYAHMNGASLVCCSLREKASMNAMRTVLRQLLFGVAPKASPEQLDPAKPVCVTAGKDNFQSIGNPPGSGWANAIVRDFPDPNPSQKGAKKSESEMVGEEIVKFPEASIDSMVEQRIEELHQYRKQVERNQRLASEGVDAGKITLFSS